MAHSFSILDISAFRASLYCRSERPLVAAFTLSVTSVISRSWLISISGHRTSSAGVLA